MEMRLWTYEIKKKLCIIYVKFGLKIFSSVKFESKK
jgi:hypothetical protein